MCLEVAVASGALVLGLILFGHFEERTPKWRRILKALLFVGITAVLSTTAGHLWAFAWILGGGALGLSVHFGWCRKHGINSWTAEPKTKYYQLRGWKL